MDDHCAIAQVQPPRLNLWHDLDFKHDGLFPDVADIDAFLFVFAGGAC